MRILLPFLLTSVSLMSLSMTAQRKNAESVAEEIMATSPRVKALGAAADAKEAQALTEGNLPDPELEGEFLAAPAGEQHRWGAGISWGLDWPGVYSARKEAAKAETEAAKWEARIEVRNLGIRTRSLLLDYILQSKQMEVIKNLLLTTDSIAALAEKARRGGEMTLLDLNKINLERASLEGRMASFRSARASTAASLAEIAGQDRTSLLESLELSFPYTSLPSEEEIGGLIRASVQARGSEAAITAADASIKASDREKLPGLTIGYRHAFEDGSHFNGGSIGVTLPIFSGKGKSKAARAALRAAETAAQETCISSEERMRSAIRRANAIEDEIAKVAPILDATDNQALLLKAYKSGVITLIEYFNERNYFLEATLDLLELRHAAAAARLDVIAEQ